MFGELVGGIALGAILGSVGFQFMHGWIDSGSLRGGFEQVGWAAMHPREALDEFLHV